MSVLIGKIALIEVASVLAQILVVSAFELKFFKRENADHYGPCRMLTASVTALSSELCSDQAP